MRHTHTNCPRQDGASPAGEGQREAANELRLRHNNRLLAVPYSLARFLAHNARAGGAPERATLSSQAGDSGGRQIGGHKRSSSALDALTGVTLGKRSTNPLEFVNFEPVFGRQNFARGPPRVYDMRWAPVDSIEAPSSYADYSK